MKVSGQQPPKTSELASGKTKAAEPRETASRHTDAREQEPSANRTSLTMTRIREVIQDTADIRTDRITELRERIRGGNYRVDADRLAARMLEEETEQS